MNCFSFSFKLIAICERIVAWLLLWLSNRWYISIRMCFLKFWFQFGLQFSIRFHYFIVRMTSPDIQTNTSASVAVHVHTRYDPLASDEHWPLCLVSSSSTFGFSLAGRYWISFARNLLLTVDLETFILWRDKCSTAWSSVIPGLWSNKLAMISFCFDVVARSGFTFGWSFTFFSRFHCSTHFLTNPSDFLIRFAVCWIVNFGPRWCKCKKTAPNRLEKYSEFMFIWSNSHSTGLVSAKWGWKRNIYKVTETQPNWIWLFCLFSTKCPGKSQHFIKICSLEE